VNHPVDASAGPNRHAYRELSWMNMSGIQSDCFDNFAEVILVLSGSFNYYFTINGRSGSAFITHSSNLYILICSRFSKDTV